MMTLYRLGTEDRHNLQELCIRYFPNGFMILRGQGAWAGQPEQSATIEVVTEDRQLVFALAADICRSNRQEAVLMMQVSLDEVRLVTETGYSVPYREDNLPTVQQVTAGTRDAL